MAIDDALALVGAVTLSFGGGAVIVIALSNYLADLWAKRILQREQSQLEQKIEEVKHELGLQKSSYEHYLDLVLDYYKVFYRHYRLCQKTATSDAVRESPNSKIVYTKDEFLEKLNAFLVDWAEQEGSIRLLLPAKLLELHGESIDCFNEFKRVIEHYTNSDEKRQQKEAAFLQIEAVKNKVESGLREFLRTERLLK